MGDIKLAGNWMSLAAIKGDSVRFHHVNLDQASDIWYEYDPGADDWVVRVTIGTNKGIKFDAFKTEKEARDCLVGMTTPPPPPPPPPPPLPADGVDDLLGIRTRLTHAGDQSE